MRSITLVALLVAASAVAAMAEGAKPASAALSITASRVIVPQVIPPRVIHNNGIMLPDELDLGQLTKAQKTVVLAVKVDPHGFTRAVHILKSAEPALDLPVLEAVHQLRFSPARLDDHPIPLQIKLTVEVVS